MNGWTYLCVRVFIYHVSMYLPILQGLEAIENNSNKNVMESKGTYPFYSFKPLLPYPIRLEP